MTNRNKRRLNDKYLVDLIRGLVREGKDNQVVICREGAFVLLGGLLWTTDIFKAKRLDGVYSPKILGNYFRRCPVTSELYETLKGLEEKGQKLYEESLAVSA